MNRLRRGASTSAVLLLAVVYAPGAASAAPPLRHVAQASSPAASDGTQYAVWLQRDGRVAILDTTTDKVRRTAAVCPAQPAARRLPAPVAGFGLAVITCAAGSADHMRVNLRTGRSTSLTIALPLQTVTDVGRYWVHGIGATGDGTNSVDYYVNRGTSKLVTYPSSATPGDPDSRGLTPIRVRTDVTRLLFSGAPFEALPTNSLIVRDPRKRRNTAILASCRQRCGLPFGRVGRLTYARYDLGRPIINLIRAGRPPLTWRLDVLSDHDLEEATVQPVVTTNTLIVSVFRAQHGWQIEKASA